MAAEEVNYMLSVVPGSLTGFAALNAGLASINNSFGDMTRQIDNNFGIIDSSIIALGVVATQVAMDAASAFGQFEQSMKIVQMVSGQTADQISFLGQKANEFSIQYRVDIDQITEGLQTLGRAGLNTATEQAEVLQNGLNTAKLEGRELNSVLQELIQNTALLGGDLKSDQFGEQSAYVNNLLVATSMTAPITTHDVSETLKYSGGIAAAAGANIESEEGKRVLEDYMGAIAAFAQKGVTGSIAGTALRAFFNKPATQDSSVTEALGSIGLTPESLWEKGGDSMKPVSEQISIIKKKMDELNVSTMDQLQIWSKIVGGKMGQQMMKLDSEDIKDITKDIRAADDAGTLATKSMQTYQANVKELGERGAKAFREFGQQIVFFVNPFLEVINKILDFFNTDIGAMPLAIGFFALISQVIKRIRNVFSRLRKEISDIYARVKGGEKVTMTSLRPQSSRGSSKYSYQSYTLENAQSLDEYAKALAFQKSASKLQKFKEKGLSDAEIGVMATTMSWTKKNERASKYAGKKISDFDMINYLGERHQLTPEMIDVLGGEGRKPEKWDLVGKEIENSFMKSYRGGILYREEQRAKEEKKPKKSTGKDDSKLSAETKKEIDNIVKEVKDSNKKKNENTEALKKNTEAINKDTTSQDTKNHQEEHVDKTTSKYENLTEKNRMILEDYNKQVKENKGVLPHAMKVDRGTKIQYEAPWISWIKEHPDKDVDFSKISAPNFDNIVNQYLQERDIPRYSPLGKQIWKRFKDREETINKTFEQYKNQTQNLVSLPYLTAEEMGDYKTASAKGFKMSVKDMKSELLGLGYTKDDLKGLKRADLANLYHPHYIDKMSPFFTSAKSFEGYSLTELKKMAKERNVDIGDKSLYGPKSKGVDTAFLQQALADDIQKKLERRLQLEEEILLVIQQQVSAAESGLFVEESKANKTNAKPISTSHITSELTLDGMKKEIKKIEKEFKGDAEAIRRESAKVRKQYLNHLKNTNPMDEAAKEFNKKYGSKFVGTTKERSKSAVRDASEGSYLSQFKSQQAIRNQFSGPTTISDKIRASYQHEVAKVKKGASSAKNWSLSAFNRMADRSGSKFGFELTKSTSILKKFANVGLNAADMMGGPLLIAIEALTIVFEWLQSQMEEYHEKVKQVGDKLSDAYSTLESAEDALRETFVEGNPGASDEDIDQMILDTYSEMYKTMTEASQGAMDKWVKATASAANKVANYEYDTQKDDGSMKELAASQKSYAEKVDENTAALYAATSELSQAMSKYVQTSADVTWGVDGLSSVISDRAGFNVTHAFGMGPNYEEQGNEFLLTATQQDDNYAGNKEMVGLMLEDFKDAASQGHDATTQIQLEALGVTREQHNAIIGLITLMGTGDEVFEYWRAIGSDAKQFLTDEANFAARIGAANNMRLQQSMQRDKSTWQSLAKEIAKQENKNKRTLGTKDTNKKIEGLIAKLQATMGGGFDRTQILQAAYLQMMQDMYSIAQSVMLPLISQNAHNVAQTMLTSQGIQQSTAGTGSSTFNTAAIAQTIAGYVAIMAKQSSKDAFYDYALDIDPEKASAEDKRLHNLALQSKDSAEFYKKSKELSEGTAWWRGWQKDTHAMEKYLEIYGATAYQTVYGMDSASALDKATKFVESSVQKGASTKDILSTLEKNYGAPQFTEALIGAYLASDIGEAKETASDKDSSDKDSSSSEKTRKERVDLVLCSKKEIPKLNVNLFKKAPSFTILNKNFKLRDIKVNTEDKPKAILSSIKNAIIDVQKRSDPKIIQDEAAEYDPVSATDGSSVPSGSTNTGTDG